MILVGVESFDPERRVFLYRGVQYFFELNQNIRFQYPAAVLGTPDDVVLMLVCGVI